MHTLLVLEIIVYVIALLLFIACCTAFIRKWFTIFVIYLVKNTLGTSGEATVQP